MIKHLREHWRDYRTVYGWAWPLRFMWFEMTWIWPGWVRHWHWMARYRLTGRIGPRRRDWHLAGGSA